MRFCDKRFAETAGTVLEIRLWVFRFKASADCSVSFEVARVSGALEAEQYKLGNLQED